MTCATCKFWEDPGGGMSGYCHRYAPRYDESGSKWPRAFRDDWCGEWKPQPKAEDWASPYHSSFDEQG